MEGATPMVISRTTVLAGTFLICGAWAAGTPSRARGESPAEQKADEQKDRVDDHAKKEKERINDRADAEKNRVDVRADEKKAAIDRRADGNARTGGSKKDGVGDEVTDTWITTKVKASFFDDKVLKGSEIHVDTDHKGVVVLSGYVPSDSARAHAIAVARDTKGVHEVQDKLRLKAGN